MRLINYKPFFSHAITFISLDKRECKYLCFKINIFYKKINNNV